MLRRVAAGNPDEDFKAFKVRVGGRVKARRRELGFGIKQVAGDADVSDDTIERLESGAAVMLDVLYTVGRVLDVSVAALVAEEAVTADPRREALAKIVRILGRHSERDVEDVLAVVGRVLDIKARAKRR